MNAQAIPEICWQVLQRAQATLELSDRVIADVMGLRLAQFRKFRHDQHDLNAIQVMRMADYLNLSFERLMTGVVDYSVLAHHFFGDHHCLPERYAYAAKSKRRNALFILNYVERFFGWRCRLNILNHFQMNESVFADPDEKISFLFASDLCDYLSRYLMNHENLASVGIASFLSTDLSLVRKELQDVQGTHEIYERIFSDLMGQYFEKSYEYKILQLSKEHCVFSARPSAELVDLLGKDAKGKPSAAVVRQGIAAAYPMILGLPPAKVVQTASFFQGDSDLRYLVQFSPVEQVC